MIQRVQSIWLLLAAVCSFLTFKFSFYYGLRIASNINEPLDATSNLLLILFAAATGLGSFIAIFLYKDRKAQLRVTIAGILVSILSLVVYASALKGYANGRFSLTSIFAILVPVFLFFAARGIWKDQKLIKSLDRLR